jgi:hypothetical protein
MTDPLDLDRSQIHQLLAGGLETDWRDRAYTHDEIRHVVRKLQALPRGDLEGRLRVSGFTLTPFVNDEAPDIEQDCKTCMYYEAHRRYCALPELKLGVEPEWSCILWRI